MDINTDKIFCDLLSNLENPEDLFTLKEKIGQGAYGIVYKAIHNSSKMTVAVKIVTTRSLSNNNALQREISLMKKCHKNEYIVKYYGSYFSKNKKEIWIILEYCESGSTIDLMKAMKRKFTEIEIASIIEMTLYGLIAMHKKKLIHRDIKGANILLNKEGYAKLGDFGVGAQLDSQAPLRASKKGSPYWMSPQVINNIEYDCKTDIWSLGITCYELCEGNPPLSEYKPLNVMKKISDSPPRGLPKGNNYSKEFNDFVSKCLVVDPHKRITAKELIEHQFIKKYSKGRVYVQNMIKTHSKEIEDFRRKINESDLDEEEEEEEEKEENKIFFQSLDFQVQGESFGSCIVKEDSEVKKDDNLNSSNIIKGNEGNNIINNNKIPEFMNYINNNNFIFDEEKYNEIMLRSNDNNNQKKIKESCKKKLKIEELGKSINLIESSIDYSGSIESSIPTERTVKHNIFDNNRNSEDLKRYIILKQFRDNNNLTLGKFIDESNSSNYSGIDNKEKLFKTQSDRDFSLEKLCQDEEISNFDNNRIEEEIQRMNLDKEYEMELINNKYQSKMKKYQFIKNSLRNFPGVKSIKEIVELYYPKDNLSNTNTFNHILTTNNETNQNSIKLEKSESLKMSMSNITEENDSPTSKEVISINNINTLKFKTHADYFDKKGI